MTAATAQRGVAAALCSASALLLWGFIARQGAVVGRGGALTTATAGSTPNTESASLVVSPLTTDGGGGGGVRVTIAPLSRFEALTHVLPSDRGNTTSGLVDTLADVFRTHPHLDQLIFHEDAASGYLAADVLANHLPTLARGDPTPYAQNFDAFCRAPPAAEPATPCQPTHMVFNSPSFRNVLVAPCPEFAAHAAHVGAFFRGADPRGLRVAGAILQTATAVAAAVLVDTGARQVAGNEDYLLQRRFPKGVVGTDGGDVAWMHLRIGLPQRLRDAAAIRSLLTTLGQIWAVGAAHDMLHALAAAPVGSIVVGGREVVGMGVCPVDGTAAPRRSFFHAAT